MKQLLFIFVFLMLSTNIGLGQNDYDQKWNQPTIFIQHRIVEKIEEVFSAIDKLKV